MKANTDSGIFTAIQMAAITGLLGDQAHLGPLNALYDRRRQVLLEGLKKLGWDKVSAASTFYVWVPIPAGTTSMAFAAACSTRPASSCPRASATARTGKAISALP